MMFREKSTSKLYAFALAAVFALTLAGCGGGGGTAEMEEEMPMPMPDPQADCMDAGGRYNADGSCTSAADLAEEAALSGAQDAAAAAAAAAMAAVGAAVDPVAASNAYGYASMAGDANTAAQAATTSADAMTHQMAAETAQGKAEEAAGTTGLGLIMLSNKVLNGDDIDNATLDGPPATVPKAVSNATNVSTAIATAAEAVIADPTDGFTNQGGHSTANETAATISAVDADTAVVAHKASGSTFSLRIGTDTLLTGEMESRFHTKGGWEAQDLLFPATDGNTKTHLVISTDIQATTEEKEYTGDGTALPDIAIITGDVPSDGSDFEVTLNLNPEDNNVPVTAQIFCPAAVTDGCAISVDEDGKIVENNDYQYRTTSETVKTADGDYLAWGMWVTGSVRDTLVGTTDDNTPDAAQAGAFAYGSNPFDVPATLSGKATYNGVANGLYSAGGMVQYFDADATLEADFGGATNVGGKISGSISGIKAAGVAIDGSLALERSDITATGSFEGLTDGVLGGNGFRGNYGGQVYGPDGRNAAAMVTTFPTTAAGTFSASTQDDKMSLIGAFGSWKAE